MRNEIKSLAGGTRKSANMRIQSMFNMKEEIKSFLTPRRNLPRRQFNAVLLNGFYEFFKCFVFLLFLYTPLFIYRIFIVIKFRKNLNR